MRLGVIVDVMVAAWSLSICHDDESNGETSYGRALFEPEAVL